LKRVLTGLDTLNSGKGLQTSDDGQDSIARA